MKRITIFLLFIFLYLGVSAQTGNDTTKFFKSPDYGWRWQRGKFIKLILPTDTVATKLGVAVKSGVLYLGDGIKWTASGTVLDTTSLSNRINLRVKYSDTASMLSSYLRASVAAATYATITNLALKLNLSDTAVMLANYLRSTVAAATYATIANLALRLNISDTASMLTTYLRSTIAAATYVPLTRTISTTSPLSGGGDLSVNRTLALDTTGWHSSAYDDTRFVHLTGAETVAGAKTFSANTAVVGSLTVTGKGLLTNTFTASANNEVGTTLNGTLMGSSTVSDIIYGVKHTQSFVAGANNQTLIDVSIKPSFNDNSKTGIAVVPFEVYGRNNEGIFKVTTATGGADAKVFIGDFNNQGWQTDLILVRPSGGGTGSTIIQGNSDLTIANTIGTGTAAIALTSSGMTLNVADKTYIAGGNVGIGTTAPTKLFQIGTVDPLISWKQATSGQEWTASVGVGTGIASGVWNLKDVTNNKYAITANANRVIIGNPLTAFATSTVFVQSNTSSGTNFDVQADSTKSDEGNIEVMKSDYSTGEGIALRGWGNVGVVGTVMGQNKKNLGLLDFNNQTNIIRSLTTSPISIAINNAKTFDFTTTSATALTPVTLKGYTVATLPTGVVGMVAYVTDALAPSFLVTIVGGGAVTTPVFYNGTNWVAQ